MKDIHVLIIDGFPPPHMWLINNRIRTTWFNYSGNMKETKQHPRIVGFPMDSIDEEWVEFAEFINKIDPVTHVLTFREKSLVKVAKISSSLNILNISEKSVAQINNKVQMRFKFKENGGIPFKKIHNLRDLQNFHKIVNKPIILKPVDGFASKNVHQIKSSENIELAWNKFSENNTIGIAEEFIFGKEYSVECCTINGRHNVICVTEKYKDSNFIELGHVLPAIMEEEIKLKISRFLIKLLNDLEIKNGITHTEIIISDEKEISLIETHLRPGGDFIPELIRYAFQIDIIDIFLSSYILENRENILKSIKHSCYSAIWFKLSPTSGVINNIEMDENEFLSDRVKKIKIQAKVGDMIRKTEDSTSRLCFAVATGNTPDEARNFAKIAVESVKFEIINKLGITTWI